MEQQLVALLQAQQMMQKKMLELMNFFASEKSDKGEKNKMEQLDWRHGRAATVQGWRVGSGSAASSGS